MPRVVIPDPNLKFNHKQHLDKQIPCSSCHGDLSKVDLATRAQLPTMAQCLGCHDNRMPSSTKAQAQRPTTSPAQVENKPPVCWADGYPAVQAALRQFVTLQQSDGFLATRFQAACWHLGSFAGMSTGWTGRKPPSAALNDPEVLCDVPQPGVVSVVPQRRGQAV